MGGRFHNAILRRCNGGSLGASAVVAVESTVHAATRAYRAVDRLVCPSRFLEGKMREAGVFPERLRWVPNFVDPGSPPPATVPRDGIVFAGRLSAEKGVDVLLRALALLPDEHLDVAGDGPSRPGLETLAAELGVADRVVFLGRIDADEVRKRLERAAVAVLPARWYENQPLAILEAFAAGTPVIGTDLGGIPELIEPGVDGEIVPAENRVALAAAIRSVVQQPARAQAMGHAARAKAEREFGPGVHRDRLYAVYDEAGGARWSR